jgi:hypothetical protein
MPIQHSAITDDVDNHEPIGVGGASLGEVYVADGVGSGEWKSILIKYTASLSPAIVALNTTAEQTFTVSGVTTSDTCLAVIKPTAQAGLGIVGWRISADDTIAITFSNNTGSGITPTAAETYVFVVLKA